MHVQLTSSYHYEEIMQNVINVEEIISLVEI